MKLSLTRAEWHERLFVLLTGLIVIALPFSVRISNIFIVLLAANWVLEGRWKTKWGLLSRNVFALLFIGFYFYHLIGILYSTDRSEALFDVEKKLPFFAFPLIFCSLPYLTDLVRKRVLTLFVGACIIASLVCLANALYHLSEGDPSFLYYHSLGSPLRFHAVYFSVYVAFCIGLTFLSMEQQWKLSSAFRRTMYLICLSYMLFFIILLSSKTIIVITALFLAMRIAWLVWKTKGPLIAAVSLSLSLASFVSVVLLVPEVQQRFKESFVDSYGQENPLFLDDYLYYHFTGANIRLAIWKIAVGVVVEERALLTGVGTGDVQSLLTAAYSRKHIYPGDDATGAEGFLNYNAHNQFLQFFVALGGLGLVWFVIIFLQLIIQARRRSDARLYLLVFLFGSFCLTESALCAQKGIVFFLMFASLLAATSSTSASTKAVGSPML